MFTMCKSYRHHAPIDFDFEGIKKIGFEYTKFKFNTLEELANEILSEGPVTPSKSNISETIWFETTEPEEDPIDPIETFYQFHPKGLDIKQMRALAELLK